MYDPKNICVPSLPSKIMPPALLYSHSPSSAQTFLYVSHGYLTTSFLFSFSDRVLWRVHDHAGVRRDRTRGRRRHCYFAGEQEHPITRHHRRSRTHRSRLHFLAGEHGVILTADTGLTYGSLTIVRIGFPKSHVPLRFPIRFGVQRVYFPSIRLERIRE